MVPDLSRRLTDEPELMDDPDSDPARLRATLDQFGPINALLSRSRGLIRALLIPHMHRAGRPVTVLDVGAGACDIDLWLSRECARRRLPVRIFCVDHDPRVVAYAARRTRNSAGITTRLADARTVCTEERFDYVIANHFLHHFGDADAAEALRLMDSAAQRGILINDLHRDLMTYVSYSLAAAVFFHRSFAFYDGRLSIRKGFRRAELENIVEHAGVKATVRRAAPGRIYLYRFS